MSANGFWSVGQQPAETAGGPEEASPVGSASREPSPNQGDNNSDVVRVTTADVLPPATLQPPTAQTFEELEIPAGFRDAVEQELTTDEKMLWVGRPSRNREVHPRNPMLPVIGNALLVLGVFIFLAVLVSAVLSQPMKFGSWQVSGCFIAAILAGIGGVLHAVSRVDPTKTCRFCYVVTNRRALIVEAGLWQKVAAQSYLPQQLLGLERLDHATVAGAGDLIFEYIFAMAGNNVNPLTGGFHQQGPSAGLSNAPQRIPRGFMCLDQAREVEDLVRATLLRHIEQAVDARTQANEESPSCSGQPVSVACACGVTIEGPAALAGKWVKCPRCTSVVALTPTEGGTAADLDACPEAASIPVDLRNKALAGLDANEKVVWMGQPVPKLVLARSSGYLAGGGGGMLVGLLWLVLALLPPKTVPPRSQQGKQPAPVPTALPASFLLLPIGLFFGSACAAAVGLVRWRNATRTCYALTNRRALVYKEGLFGPTRASYTPMEVSGMRRSPSWLVAGTGDLIFRTVQVVSTSRNQRGGSSTSARTIHYGFLAIAQLGEVEKLVRETLIDRFVDKLTQASALR